MYYSTHGARMFFPRSIVDVDAAPRGWKFARDQGQLRCDDRRVIARSDHGHGASVHLRRRRSDRWRRCVGGPMRQLARRPMRVQMPVRGQPADDYTSNEYQSSPYA